VHLGDVLAGLGRLEKARAAYHEGSALRHESSRGSHPMNAFAGLPRVALAQGKLSEVQAPVEEVLSHLEDHSLATGFGPHSSSACI
jgi:hypothetical protein